MHQPRVSRLARVVLFALTALSAGPALEAQAPAPAPAPAAVPRASDIPTIAFEKYRLPNGLEVILSEDHRLPLVAVNVWYHVGPANEEPGRTGFAHLFEHMMFQGSKHAPGDMHFRMVEGAGGSSTNGTTGFDRTNYFQTLPAHQLELGLWLESDRMAYLLHQVESANLSKQQDLVRTEAASNYQTGRTGSCRRPCTTILPAQGTL